MPDSTFDINSLSSIVANISEAQNNYFAEGCSVALEKQDKTPGVMLAVSGEIETKIKLQWNKSNAQGSWKEEKKIAEAGAIAIAFFLVLNFTKYTIVEESVTKTGIDYWLSDELNNKSTNFFEARLEVSGINKENKTNNITNRLNVKLKQSEQSDDTLLPAYIVIAEFGNPKAILKKK